MANWWPSRTSRSTVGGGEFVSILGPSGCGKSTLLRCVAGLDRPTKGSITFGGKPVDGPPLDMGFVFQRDVLTRLVECNRQRSSALPDQETADRRVEIESLCAAEAHRPSRLRTATTLGAFGGCVSASRFAARCLLDPSLLLMDEPFGALDAMTRDELNLELQNVWLTNAKTVLFVTHSISEAVFLSDRVLVMSPSPGGASWISFKSICRVRDRSRYAKRQSSPVILLISVNCLRVSVF